MSRDKSLVALVLTFCSGIYTAQSIAFSPYVGLDGQLRHMKYKTGYGDNMLKAVAPQGNIYAGIHLKDSVALELGYEFAKTRARTTTLQEGDMMAGNLLDSACAPAVLKSRARINGPHINLVGFYGFAQDQAFKLLGSVGVGMFRGFYERATLQYGPSALPGTTRVWSKNKAVVRLTGGVQYMLGKNFGTRLTIGWVNTTKVSATTQSGSSSTLTFKPRNTTFYGLGIFWAF